MCGLFGHTHDGNISFQKSRDALDTLLHRGPDQWGEWSDENIYMGHRRLSILDLSENARQPMENEDSSIILSANGEIYNFMDLRSKLALNHDFRSHSDSEVLLHGYEEWGLEGLLDRIDGMFAFTIYDKRINRIFLVRDRVGIKPVYYAHINGCFSWASELKAIEKFIGKDTLEFDNTALYDFLTYTYVPAPKTMYENTFKLEAAHYIEFDIHNRTFEKHRYWALNPTEHTVSVDDASMQLKTLVTESVQEQMISDVPLGFFLSGGLDSSIVVAAASTVSENIHTYTIGFSEAAYDERVYARQVANKFNVKYHEKLLSESAIPDLFDSLKTWYDEPFADTSAFPSYLVCAAAREDVTVVLTGDGGDEIFGGYKRYSRFTRALRISALGFLRPVTSWIGKTGKQTLLSRAARRFERDVMFDDLELYTRLLNGLTREEKSDYRIELEIPDDYDDYWYFRKYYRTDLSVRTRLQYLDFHTYLPEEMLTKVDRVSMAVSLEARVPLLSRSLIEFAFSIPEAIRYDQGRLKGLLKTAYKNTLPNEVIERPKKGFSIPIHEWGDALLSGYPHITESILNRLFLKS